MMDLPEPTPLHCRPAAFAALAQQIDALDTTRGLLRCALAVSMHELAELDADEVEEQIDALAGTITDRLRSREPRALLAHTHAVLFDEARFTGNRDDYYHPDNSYVSRVLETRRGSPITLTLIYKCVLESVGVKVLGINAPGHFLAGVSDGSLTAYQVSGPRPSTPILIDVFFAGRILTRQEAFNRIEEIAGGAVAHNEALLRPATHAQWLTRIIQNLVTAFERLKQPHDRAAMLELRALVESVV